MSKPAYKSDPGLTRVSRGSVSKPSDPGTPRYRTFPEDATPKRVSRGSVSHPKN